MRPYVWFQAEEVVDMDREVQFLLYNMPEDSGKVQVVIKDETIWCTPKAMAQLFGVGVPAVSKHLKNIFEEGGTFIRNDYFQNGNNHKQRQTRRSQ